MLKIWRKIKEEYSEKLNFDKFIKIQAEGIFWKNFRKSQGKFKGIFKKLLKKISGNFVKIYQNSLKLFSKSTWISSNYPKFLKFSEKQVQNMNKFSLKFTKALFVIYLSFLKIFSKIFKISAKFSRIFLWFFFRNFNKYYLKLTLFPNFRFIFWPVQLLLFHQISTFSQSFNQNFHYC